MPRREGLPIDVRFADHALAPPRVDVIELEQALNQLFELRLVLRYEGKPPPPADLVGRSLTADLVEEPFVPHIQGVVARARWLDGQDGTRVELRVLPYCGLALHRRQHRILQDQTSVEIASLILDPYHSRHAGGSPASDLRIQGPVRRREYVVQYGESDWAFAARLLADDGIVLFFDHGSDSRPVLTDDSGAATARLEVALDYRPVEGLDRGLATARAGVRRVDVESCVAHDGVVLRDYDPTKPNLLLEAATSGTSRRDATIGQWYEYATEAFDDERRGAQRSHQVLEELRARAVVVHCEATCLLSPGTRFRIDDYPHHDLGPLLVVRSTMSGRDEAGSFRAMYRLECIPENVTYRPSRLPKPRIEGSQTAFVVGAPGEEIDVDTSGRVEVQFRWDRRDTNTTGASRRVRVGQPWAGSAHGLHMIPRVGDEVIVSFVDGDPDQPIIVGSVHNGLAAPPPSLPAEKSHLVLRSRSTPGGAGFNELRLIDSAGAEELSLRAQRDLVVLAQNNASRFVGLDDDIQVARHQTTTVTGRQSTAVRQGVSQFVGAHTSQTTNGPCNIDATTVTICCDDYELTASGDVMVTAATVDISCDRLQAYTMDTLIFGDSSILLQSSTATVELTPGRVLLSVDGSSIEITAGGVTIIAPLIELNP